MGILGFTVLIVASLVFGLGVQLVMRPASIYDWLIVAAVTAIGGFVGSELLTSNMFTGIANTYALDGLIVFPAVITGLVLGMLAEAAIRVAVPEGTAA